MNKKVLWLALACFLASCGNAPQRTSNTTDHVTIDDHNDVYMVFENIDTNMVYLAKCSKGDLIKIKEIYKDYDTKIEIEKRLAWLLSKDNSCHQPLHGSRALDKKLYLDLLLMRVEIGQSAEQKLLEHLELNIAEVNEGVEILKSDQEYAQVKIDENRKQITKLKEQVIPNVEKKILNIESLLVYLELKLKEALNQMTSGIQVTNIKKQISFNMVKLQELKISLLNFFEEAEDLEFDITSGGLKTGLDEIVQQLILSKEKIQLLQQKYVRDLDAVKKQSIEVKNQLNVAKFSLINFESPYIVNFLLSSFMETES